MLKRYSDLDDSRVGVKAASLSSEPLPQPSISPQSKRDSQRNARDYDQQLYDITLMREIDSQLAEVATFCREVQETSIQAACQDLIVALENFRSKYYKAQQFKACLLKSLRAFHSVDTPRHRWLLGIQEGGLRNKRSFGDL